MQRDRADEIICARAEVDRRVQRAVRVQAHEPLAHLAVEGREVAAHHHASIRLHRDGTDVIIRARAWGEGAIHRACAGQPCETGSRRAVHRGECAADENLPAARERNRVHRSVRAGPGVEGCVERAVAVQPRDAGARRAVVKCEVAADQNLAVRLQGHGAHGAVRARADREAHIHRAVRVHARDAVARHAIDCREKSADDDAPVQLQRQRKHAVVESRAEVEGVVERAVRIRTAEVGAGDEIIRGEQTAEDDLAVGLRRDRAHRAVRAEAAVEGGVERAVNVQPRQPVHALHADDGGEVAADRELAGVGGQGRVRENGRSINGARGNVPGIKLRRGQAAAGQHHHSAALDSVEFLEVAANGEGLRHERVNSRNDRHIIEDHGRGHVQVKTHPDHIHEAGPEGRHAVHQLHGAAAGGGRRHDPGEVGHDDTLQREGEAVQAEFLRRAIHAENLRRRPRSVGGGVEMTAGQAAQGQAVLRVIRLGREISGQRIKCHHGHRRRHAAGDEAEGMNRCIGSAAHVKTGVQGTVGIQTRDPRRRIAIEGSEVPDDEHMAVAFHRHGPDRGQRAQPDAKAGVHRAVRVQAGDVIARRAVDGKELAADDDLAVRSDGDAMDHAIRAESGVEGGVERAIRIEPGQTRDEEAAVAREIARDQNLSVRLHGHGAHRRVRTRAEEESQVPRAIGIQAREARGGDAIVTRKVAADENLPVRHRRQGADQIVRPHRRSKCGVHRTVQQEPGHAAARHAVHIRERAGDDHAVRHRGDGLHRAVRARARLEAGVHRAIRGQAGDAVHGQPVELREVAAHVEALQIIEGHRAHETFRAKIVVEERVHRAGQRSDGLVVRDRQHGVARCRHVGGHAHGVAQDQVHGLGRVEKVVVNDRHDERPWGRIARRPVQHARDRDEIHAAKGRAVRRRGVSHGDRVVRHAHAQHGDDRAAHVLGHGVSGGGEAQRGVVVHDVQRGGRPGDRADVGALQVAQAEAHGFQTFALGVVDERDGEGLGVFAIKEGERAVAGKIIHARERRAAAHRVVHGQESAATVRAHDTDIHHTRRFVEEEVVGQECDIGLHDLVVGNGDGGVGGEDEHAARRLRQGKEEGLIILRLEIIDDADGHDLERLALGEGDDDVGRRVILEGGGGQVAGREPDLHVAERAVGAEQCDCNGARRLVHHKVVGREQDRAVRGVVINQVQHGVRDAERGRAAGIA